MSCTGIINILFHNHEIIIAGYASSFGKAPGNVRRGERARKEAIALGERLCDLIRILKKEGPSAMDEELRNKLEKAYKILYMEGLAEDERGHITVKSEDQRIFIKPWGIGFEEVTNQDFLGVDLDGNILEGKGRLHSELILHLEIFRKKREVVSIAHVHPFYAIVLSAVFNGKMRIVGQHGSHFFNGVPFYASEEVIHTKKQATKLVKTLGDKLVVLMKNHGIVTVGKSIEEAVILAIHFEKAAKEHLMVSPFRKVNEFSVAAAKKLNENNRTPEVFRMLWDYYCRKLERKSHEQ